MTTDSGQLFGDLAMRLHDEGDVGGLVGAVLSFAVEALDYSHASILLVESGRAQAVAATDPIVTAADQLQIDLGEGPSLSALTDSASVVVVDTAVDPRWPNWAPQAAASGIGSLHAIRLHTVGRNYRGVLKLSRAVPATVAESDAIAAHLLALHASIALTSARHEASLRLAIDSRTDVGQAVGTLVERYKIDAVNAFAVLRRYSQDSNVKLRRVAQHLNETGRLE